MTALRWPLAALASLLVLAVFGARAAGLQPSALRVVVTAGIALIAPLFWPGRAATPVRTLLRVAAWSFGTACLAAIVLVAADPPRQTLGRIAPPCAMLMCILFVTYALAAGLEARFVGAGVASDSAREAAGRAVTFALALVGSLALWFGPAAELLARAHPWILDAAVGVSPLTHLAVMSGNDLLRNPWLYQHSNLAALQVSYPEPTDLVVAYAVVSLVLAVLPLASLRRRHAIDHSGPTQSVTEQTKC